MTRLEYRLPIPLIPFITMPQSTLLLHFAFDTFSDSLHLNTFILLLFSMLITLRYHSPHRWDLDLRTFTFLVVYYIYHFYHYPFTTP